MTRRQFLISCASGCLVAGMVQPDPILLRTVTIKAGSVIRVLKEINTRYVIEPGCRIGKILTRFHWSLRPSSAVELHADARGFSQIDYIGVVQDRVPWWVRVLRVRSA